MGTGRLQDGDADAEHSDAQQSAGDVVEKAAVVVRDGGCPSSLADVIKKEKPPVSNGQTLSDAPQLADELPERGEVILRNRVQYALTRFQATDDGTDEGIIRSLQNPIQDYSVDA